MKSFSEKKSRGHRTSKIVKSNQSYSKGHLPGAPDGGVPQNICSAVEIQLAGKLIIAADFSWEFRALSSISSRAGWIFQKTERDWKSTLVGTPCKRHFVKDRWIK